MDVRSIITQQAEAAGVDPSIALSIAQAESSLNPAAKNPNSSAAGLFQVIDSTWSQYGGAKGKKLDPQENARVGVSIISDNARRLREILGRDPSASDIYATHVFGPTGGKKLLSASEDTPINQILSKNAIKANRLQGKTAGDVLAWIESKVPSEKRAKPVSEKTPVPTPAADTPFQLGPDPRLVAQGPRDAVAMTADLGPGYQAALGAMYLADANEDKDPDAGELSVAEQYLATDEGPKTASMMKKMADELAMSAPAVVGMADGGMVDDPEAAVFEEPGVQTGVTAAEMLKGMGSTYYDMAKGATQATVGLPGDIELFGRILSGQEDPDTVFPTTDEAKAFIDRIAPALGAPTAPEGRTPGEAFGEWMDISGLAKPAVAGAKALGRGAKNLAASDTAYRMLERFMEPSRASIIRNEPGGMILPNQSGVGDQASRALDEVLDNTGFSPENEEPIKEFLQKRFGKYLRSTAGSPQDPFMKALDEGKNLHFVPEQSPTLYSELNWAMPRQPGLDKLYRNRQEYSFYGDSLTNRAKAYRMGAGTPPENQFKSTSAKQLENFLDTEILMDRLSLHSPEDFPNNPSLFSVFDKENDTKVIADYGQTLDAVGAQRMGVMLDRMIENAADPDLPRDLAITPEQLGSMSLIDASEKVARFEKWFDQKVGGEAARAFFSDAIQDTGMIAPNGSVWRRATYQGSQNPEQVREATRKIGKYTDWCTQGKEVCDNYLKYGDLYILGDERGRPELQAYLSYTPDGTFTLDEIADSSNNHLLRDQDLMNAQNFIVNMPITYMDRDIASSLGVAKAENFLRPLSQKYGLSFEQQKQFWDRLPNKDMYHTQEMMEEYMSRFLGQ